MLDGAPKRRRVLGEAPRRMVRPRVVELGVSLDRPRARIRYYTLCSPGRGFNGRARLHTIYVSSNGYTIAALRERGLSFGS